MEDAGMDPVELARRLGATTMFSSLPQGQLLALLERSPRRQANAGQWLTEEARGLCDHLVLLAGELEVQRTWTGRDGRVQVGAWRIAVNADGPGFSLLSAAGSGMRVRARADSEVLAIDSDALDEMLGWSHLGDIHLPLKYLKVFHKVPLENVQAAFERMTERAVESGETIVTQGEPGDAYFVILSGEAEVWVTDPFTDETARVTVLGEGDGFGEEALLLEGARTATVKMISPGRLLVLGKPDFDQLLKPAMVAEVDAAAARELLERSAAKLIDCRYPAEYEEGHIPGAQLVPLDRLRREGVFTVDPQPRYIVYCRSGRRSRAAVFLLRERGVQAVSLAGGIRDWPYEVESTPA
jgi:rhodanese-related sulfurtransferase